MTPKEAVELAIKTLRERMDMIERQARRFTDADDEVRLSISNEMQYAVVRVKHKYQSDGLGVEEWDTMHEYTGDEEKPRALGYGELAEAMLDAIAADTCEGLAMALCEARELEEKQGS